MSCCCSDVLHRLKALQQLHLAHTNIGPASVPLLASLGQLSFLDARATAIRRPHLQLLQLKFKLQAIQGVVLTRSNAMAAAALNHGGLFVCVCCRQGQADAAEGAARISAGMSSMEAAAEAAAAVQLQTATGSTQPGRRDRKRCRAGGGEGQPMLTVASGSGAGGSEGGVIATAQDLAAWTVEGIATLVQAAAVLEAFAAAAMHGRER